MAKRKISPLMLAPPLLFAGFVALAGIGMFTTDSSELRSTRVGQVAPAITDTALSGYAPVTAETLATGEVILVNFWASWCPPCRLEHPNLLKLADEGMNIVGVNFKDAEGAATGYLRDDGNPFSAVAFDPAGRSAIDWGVTAPPETFILGPDGTVLYRFAGPLVGADYENRFLPELEKARASQ
ncbi:MAG: DsbE family thiol:disulfide interchange protein [Roseobacter sp.]